MKPNSAILIMLFFTTAFAGCASISSWKETTNNSKGLVYFLPLKDFKITLTFSNRDIKAVNFDVTDAYPDRKNPYILTHNINLFGDNKTDLKINTKGLLSSATSSVDSKVHDSLVSLAKFAGELLVLAEVGSEKEKKRGGLQFLCDINNNSGDRTFVVIIGAIKENLDVDHELCGITIKIMPKNDLDNVVGVDQNTDGPGIFYRQDIPYLITAFREKLLNTQATVYTPSLSKPHFLPISKSFFANNKADFAFSDGVPTTYKQDTYSELAELFKLPGDIVEGVFNGIGAVFNAFKTNAGYEKDLATYQKEILEQRILRDRNEYLRNECRAAITANDNSLINKFCIVNN